MVDSYRRKYRIGLPDVAGPVELPEKQKQSLNPSAPRLVCLAVAGMYSCGRERRLCSLSSKDRRKMSSKNHRRCVRKIYRF